MDIQKLNIIKEMESKYNFKFQIDNKFYQSLYKFYDKTGFLTEKQIKRAKNPIVIDTSRGFSSDLDKEYSLANF